MLRQLEVPLWLEVLAAVIGILIVMGVAALAVWVKRWGPGHRVESGREESGREESGPEAWRHQKPF